MACPFPGSGFTPASFRSPAPASTTKVSTAFPCGDLLVSLDSSVSPAGFPCHDVGNAPNPHPRAARTTMTEHDHPRARGRRQCGPGVGREVPQPGQDLERRAESAADCRGRAASARDGPRPGLRRGRGRHLARQPRLEGHRRRRLRRRAGAGRSARAGTRPGREHHVGAAGSGRLGARGTLRPGHGPVPAFHRDALAAGPAAGRRRGADRRHAADCGPPPRRAAAVGAAS